MKNLQRVANTSFYTSVNTNNHHFIYFNRNLDTDQTDYGKNDFWRAGTAALMLYSPTRITEDLADFDKIEKLFMAYVNSIEGKEVHSIFYIDAIKDLEKLTSYKDLPHRFNYLSIKWDNIAGDKTIDSYSIKQGKHYSIDLEGDIVTYSDDDYLVIQGGTMSHSFNRDFQLIDVVRISLNTQNPGQLIFESGIKQKRDFRIGINYYQQANNQLERYNYQPFEFSNDQRFRFFIYPFKRSVITGVNGQTDNAIGESVAIPLIEDELILFSNMYLTDGEKAKIRIEDHQFRLRLVGVPHPEEELMDSVAFAPEGWVTVEHPTKDIDTIKLLLGTSGTETIEMNNGSTIQFSISNQAFLNLDPQIENPSDRLTTFDQNRNLRTSWLKIKGPDKIYNNQPQESPLYGNNMDHHIYPHYQNTQGLDDDKVLDFPALPSFESASTLQEILATRRQEIIADVISGFRANKAITTTQAYTTTTPGGVLAKPNAKGEVEALKFAVSEDDDEILFEIDSPYRPFVESLMKDGAFVVVKPALQHKIFENEAPKGKDKVAFAGWAFPVFDTSAGNTDTFTIFKFNKLSIREMAKEKNLTKWTNKGEKNVKYLQQTQLALAEWIKKIDKKYDDANDKKDYEDILSILDDPTWQGVLVADINLGEVVPDELKGLLSRRKNSAVSQEKTVVLFLAFPMSKIKQKENGEFELMNTSYFGLVDYNIGKKEVSDYFKSGNIKDYDFLCHRLLVKFNNSEIKKFDCQLDLYVPELFSDSVKIYDGGSPIDRIPLQGVYQKSGDEGEYSFGLPDKVSILADFSEEGKKPLLKSISIEKAKILYKNDTYKFSIDGSIAVNASLGDVKKYFDFSGISFKNLGLSFSFLNDIREAISFDLSGFDFKPDFNFSKGGNNGFLSSFPLKFNRFINNEENGKASDMGFFSLLDCDTDHQCPGNRFKYGVLFDLDLGGLGNLSVLKKISANVLVTWNVTDQSKYELGLWFKFSGISGVKLKISIQDVFKLSIDSLSLCNGSINGTQFFYILLNNCEISILGKGLDGISGILISNLSNSSSKNAWFLTYENNTNESDGEITFPQTEEGNNDSKFKLNFLGLGQHYGLSNDQIEKVKTVNDAIDALNSPFKEEADCEMNLKLISDHYHPEVNWLIASKLKFVGLLDLDFVFIDPQLYGANLKLKDLFSLEILYKKVAEGIGVWSADFGLSDNLRYQDFGAFSLTFPDLGIDLFTNGDFKLDIGFPKGVDFSRSGAAEAGIFHGEFGMYLAKLTGPTSPLPGCGGFVLQAGFAMAIGIGRSIHKGIFKATAKISVFGTLEGAFCFMKITEPNDLLPEDYWIRGRVGVKGVAYAIVDFELVKAKAWIKMAVWATITLKKDLQRIPITLEGMVEIGITFVLKRICVSFFGKKKCWEIKIRFKYEQHVTLIKTVIKPHRILEIQNEIRALGTYQHRTPLEILYYPSVELSAEGLYLMHNYSLFQGTWDLPETIDNDTTIEYAENPDNVSQHLNVLKKITERILAKLDSLKTDEYYSEKRLAAEIDTLITKEFIDDNFQFVLVNGISKDDPDYKWLDIPGKELKTVPVFFPAVAPFEASFYMNKAKMIETDFTREGKFKGDFADRLDNFYDSHFERGLLRGKEADFDLNQKLILDYFKFITRSALSQIDEGKSIEQINYDLIITSINTTFFSGLQMPSPKELEDRNDVSLSLYKLTGQLQDLNPEGISDDSIFYFDCHWHFGSIINYPTDHTEWMGKLDQPEEQSKEFTQDLKVYKLLSDEKKLAEILTKANTPDINKPDLDRPFDTPVWEVALGTDTQLTGTETNLFALPNKLAGNYWQLELVKYKRERETINQNNNGIPIVFQAITIVNIGLTPYFSSSENDDEKKHAWFEIQIAKEETTFLLAKVASYLNESGLTEEQLKNSQISFWRVSQDSRTEITGNVSIYKSNLSTISNPGSRILENKNNYWTNVSDFKLFSTLLAQASITNSGGYFIKFDTQIEWEGSDQLELHINFTPLGGNHQIFEFTNYIGLQLADIPNTDSQEALVFTNIKNAANTLIKEFAPKTNQDELLFTWERLIPEVPEARAGETDAQRNERIEATILNDYSLLEYEVKITGNIPVISMHNCIPLNPLELEDAPDNYWTYKGQIPISEFNDTDERKNRYDNIGKTIQISGNWRSRLGNSGNADHFEIVSDRQLGYTDKIIAINEWPGLSLSYDTKRRKNGDLEFVFNFAEMVKSIIKRFKTVAGDKEIITSDRLPLIKQELDMVIASVVSKYDLILDQIADERLSICFGLDFKSSEDIPKVDLKRKSLYADLNKKVRKQLLSELSNSKFPDSGDFNDGQLSLHEFYDKTRFGIWSLTHNKCLLKSFSISVSIDDYIERFEDENYPATIETFSPTIWLFRNHEFVDQSIKDIQQAEENIYQGINDVWERKSLIPLHNSNKEKRSNNVNELTLTGIDSLPEISENIIWGTGLNEKGLSQIWLVNKTRITATLNLDNTNLSLYGIKPIAEKKWQSSGVEKIDLDKYFRLCLEAIEKLSKPEFIDLIKETNDGLNDLLNLKEELSAYLVGKDANLIAPLTTASEEKEANAEPPVDELKELLLFDLNKFYHLEALTSCNLNDQKRPEANERFYLKAETQIEPGTNKYKQKQNPLGVHVSKLVLGQHSKLSVLLDYLPNNSELSNEDRLSLSSTINLNITHVEHNIKPIDNDKYEASQWVSLLSPIRLNDLSVNDLPIIKREFPVDPVFKKHGINGDTFIPSAQLNEVGDWTYKASFEVEIDPDRDFVEIVFDYKKSSTHTNLKPDVARKGLNHAAIAKAGQWLTDSNLSNANDQELKDLVTTLKTIYSSDGFQNSRVTIDSKYKLKLVYRSEGLQIDKAASNQDIKCNLIGATVEDIKDGLKKIKFTVEWIQFREQGEFLNLNVLKSIKSVKPAIRIVRNDFDHVSPEFFYYSEWFRSPGFFTPYLIYGTIGLSNYQDYESLLKNIQNAEIKTEVFRQFSISDQTTSKVPFGLINLSSQSRNDFKTSINHLYVTMLEESVNGDFVQDLTIFQHKNDEEYMTDPTEKMNKPLVRIQKLTAKIK